MKLMGYWLVVLIVVVSCENSKEKTSRNSTTQVITIQDSVDYYTGLIASDSSNYELFSKRAALYIRSGRIDPAFRDINTALELNQEDPDVFILLGDVYFILGQTDNSLNSYKKAYSLDRENVAPLLSLAEANLVLQDYNESSRYLDMASAVDVSHPKTYYLRGILSMETGDTASALTNLKIAGNIDSLYFDAFMQTGSILSSMGDSAAVDYYRAALVASPSDERALFLTALSTQENGDFSDALELYDRLLALYPENKYAAFNSGYIHLVEFEEYDVAIDFFRKAIMIDPAFVSAVYNLGRSYEAKGMYDEARKQYRQALTLETNYPLAVDGLNRLDEIQY